MADESNLTFISEFSPATLLLRRTNIWGSFSTAVICRSHLQTSWQCLY